MNFDSLIVRGASLGVLMLALAVPQCGVGTDTTTASTETEHQAAPPADEARQLPARIRSAASTP